ncbi:MAG: hypothetical protein ACUZ8N_10860 [Candidatus Scalindua sp.]
MHISSAASSVVPHSVPNQSKVEGAKPDKHDNNAAATTQTDSTASVTSTLGNQINVTA